MRSLIVALALVHLTVGSALAFGTINTLGQNAEHERITRGALSTLGPKTLDELAGKEGTFGAVGAPDRPNGGLLTASKAHCDNGDYFSIAKYPQSKEAAQKTLEECRAWIIENLNDAVGKAADLAPTAENMKLDGCDEAALSTKCAVLKSLGIALHASQDFYSHTNWVDKPDSNKKIQTENPPGLGHDVMASWLDPRQASPAFPEGLISGCFTAVPEAGFCNYGGAGPILAKHRVKHAYLNKDKGLISSGAATGPGTTDRGKINGNFERAVSVAVADTRDKWSYFKERVVKEYGAAKARTILCAMEHDSAAECAPK